MPITWQNVNAANSSGIIDSYNAANKEFANAISGIGNTLQTGVKDFQNNQTNEFINALNQAPDEATRQQMIAEAKNAFLDMSRINQANQAITGNERTTLAYNQGQEDRAYQLNQRPIQEQFERARLLSTQQQNQLNQLNIAREIESASERKLAKNREGVVARANVTDYFSPEEISSTLARIGSLQGNALSQQNIDSITTGLRNSLLTRSPSMDVPTAEALVEKALSSFGDTYKLQKEQAGINDKAKNTTQKASEDAFQKSHELVETHKANVSAKGLAGANLSYGKQVIKDLVPDIEDKDIIEGINTLTSKIEAAYPKESDSVKAEVFRNIISKGAVKHWWHDGFSIPDPNDPTDSIDVENLTKDDIALLAPLKKKDTK